VLTEVKGTWIMEKLTSPTVIIRSLWFLLILIAVFTLEKVLGDVASSRLLLILAAIVLVSIVSVFIGFTVSRDILNMADRAEYLQHGLEELQKHQTIFVSNDMLKKIEHGAYKIRIVSPDLYDDQHMFYETVLTNVKANKYYEYVIPDRPDLISKMDRLLEYLKRDAKISDDQGIPVRYRVCTDFPIILEFVVYDSPRFEGLKGFSEIRIGPNPSDNTNIPLSNEDTYVLNRWFDELFV